jgi:hypothetical protein
MPRERMQCARTAARDFEDPGTVRICYHSDERDPRFPVGRMPHTVKIR